jgi:hypothetical protein
VGQSDGLVRSAGSILQGRQPAPGEIDVALCVAGGRRLHTGERLLGPILNREQAIARV